MAYDLLYLLNFMFIFHPMLRGFVLAPHNFVITKGFLYFQFVDFYNLNPSLEHDKKRYITEKKLEFFISSLYTCTFIREYPYTSTAAQNNELLLTLPGTITFICSTHDMIIINGQWVPNPFTSQQPDWSETFFKCQSFSIFLIKN